MSEVSKFRLEDIIYCVLPLYHTSAGMIAVGTVITRGTTLVVRRKFSASRFWDECIRYKATVRFNVEEIEFVRAQGR